MGSRISILTSICCRLVGRRWLVSNSFPSASLALRTTGLVCCFHDEATIIKQYSQKKKKETKQNKTNKQTNKKKKLGNAFSNRTSR